MRVLFGHRKNIAVSVKLSGVMLLPLTGFCVKTVKNGLVKRNHVRQLLDTCFSKSVNVRVLTNSESTNS